jgi:Curli production assembly/transport component CsgG
MKIRVLLLIWFAMSVSPLVHSQQSSQVSLGILKADSQRNIPDNVDRAIEQFIYNKFASQKRFKVLERARFNAVNAERQFQEINDVENQSAIQSTGAQFVLFTEITQADVIQKREDDTVWYEATIAYGVRLIDVSSGQIVQSANFSTGRGNYFSGLSAIFSGNNDTPAGAIDIAVQQTAKEFDMFVARAFPILGTIVSVESSNKKGEPQTVLVSLGEADGVTKKTNFSVFQKQTITVGGKDLQRRKPIGTLTVVRFEGDSLTLAKVATGATQLISAAGSDDIGVEIVVGGSK